MTELLKNSLINYALLTAFIGYVVLTIIIAIFKNTNSIKDKILIAFLRYGLSVALALLWVWQFVYISLYPISLAYYEFNHDLAKEKNGVIESIEINAKDRMTITIDNTEYTMVRSSGSPAAIAGKDFKEGDSVTIKYGAKSKFIFDVNNNEKSSAVLGRFLAHQQFFATLRIFI